MKRAAFGLVALLSFGVGTYAVVAYALLPLGTVVHPELRDAFLAQGATLLYLHIFAAAVALLLGPLQFRGALRASRPRLHRWLGRAYLLLGVGIGGSSGLVLALNASGGPWARSGFAMLALLWIASAAIALRCILMGNAAAHQRWMRRNFALALAAVSLRLLLPAMVAGGVGVATAYAWVAWLCWLPNLLVAEWLIRRGQPAPAEPGHALRAPG